MAFIIIITLLFIVASFLAFKLFFIKQQLKDMTKQLQEQDEGMVSVEFVDKNLELLATQINCKSEQLQKVKADNEKHEQTMKTAISMISHDMRTPLTSVIGYIQLAEKNCKDKETLQNLRIALDRARYSNKLVDDFFELSLAETDQYIATPEKVNLCEAVCEEILANYLSFESKGITPDFQQADDEIFILADKKMLSRVIQNLISNGIKYSASDIKFQILESDFVTLTISNSVSEAIDTEKIFQKFYRADVSRKGEGTGLGLYICRKFVEEMNGKITAKYSDGKLIVTLKFNTL